MVLTPNSVLGESVVAVLTSAGDAARTAADISDVLKFQLWVAVKLAEPIVGLTTLDFYGAYVQNALAAGARRLRA